MSGEYPTSEEWAARMSEALTAPLRQVGELLAKEVDELNAEVAALRRDLDELGRRVDPLAELGPDAGRLHSVKVPE